MEAVVELQQIHEDQRMTTHPKESDVLVLEALLLRPCGSTECSVSCSKEDGMVDLPTHHHFRHWRPRRLANSALSSLSFRRMRGSRRICEFVEHRQMTPFSSSSCLGPLERPWAAPAVEASRKVVSTWRLWSSIG